MKPARLLLSADGPLWLLTTVRSPLPFALSLSKGQAELVEALVPRAEGFDKLSPNGILLSVRPEPVEGLAELVEAFVPHAEGFDRLSPNGDNAGLSFDTSGRSEQPAQPEQFCCRP